MATKTFTINADAMVMQNAPTTAGGTRYPDNLYAGESVLWDTLNGFFVDQGAIWRSLLKFNLDWSGVVSITSARLYIHSTADSTVWVGSSPTVTIKRASSSWSESTVTWNTAPGGSSTHAVTANLSAGHGVWSSVDITGIVTDWAPTSIGGGGLTNYGLYVMEGSSADADALGFDSRETAYDAYIVLTYTTNSAPNAPTNLSPTSGAVQSSQTPTLSAKFSDPDVESTAKIQWQVSTVSTFASTVMDTGLAAQVVGNNATGTKVVSPSLTRGTLYYWRVRAQDSGGLTGPWSATASFKIASLPTAAVTSPVASGIAELSYVAGVGGNPKLRVRWTFTDADGHTQSSAVIKIYADNVGAPGTLLSTETSTGTAVVFDSAYAIAADTKYWVSVTPTCSLGLAGAESTKITGRTRWGRGAYYFDATSAPSSIKVSSNVTVGTNQSLILEYATSSGIVSEPTTWYSSIAAAGLNRYLWYRITELAWGTSPATSPKLNDLTWTYVSAVPTPDNWTLSAVATIDTGFSVFGTQSMKHSSAGVAATTYQIIDTINPNTDYSLSGYIKTLGAPNAQIQIIDPTTGTVLVSVTAASNTDATRYSTAWNSGAYTSIKLGLYTDGASSTAWFDALKLEQSTVVTAWTPGFVAEAVTIDSGGIIIDEQAGGVFRLRTASGTVKTLSDLALGANPTGAIIAYGAASAPDGYLLCDGSSVLRTTYANLFNVIGTTYGSVDGTHFTLPDLRQRFPLGKAASGTGSTLGGTGGGIDHTHTGPSHTHTSAGHTHTLSHSGYAEIKVSAGSSTFAVRQTSVAATSWTPISSPNNAAYSASDTTAQTAGAGLGGSTDSTTPAATGASGTAATGTNNPPFQVVNYIIKT